MTNMLSCSIVLDEGKLRIHVRLYKVHDQVHGKYIYCIGDTVLTSCILVAYIY